jgi:hypothetical protein
VPRNMLVGLSRRVITNACHFIILVVVEMIITMTPKIHVLNSVHQLSVGISFLSKWNFPDSFCLTKNILSFSQRHLSASRRHWKLPDLRHQLVL